MTSEPETYCSRTGDEGSGCPDSCRVEYYTAADYRALQAQYDELERAELVRDAMWEKDRAELAEWRDLSNGGSLARRAERAEAEHLNQVRLNLKMDAALARVRALCEELHDTDEIVTEAYDRLRAAIEEAP